MITDDTGTAARGKWVLCLAYTRHQTQGRVLRETPYFDLTYGLAHRVEVTVEVPWLLDSTANKSTLQGYGDGAIGFKWRFIDGEDGGLAVSVSPQFVFNIPRRSTSQDLVEKDASFALPFQASISAGSLDINLEVGMVFHRNVPNELQYGLVLGHTFSNDVELALEYRFSQELTSSSRERILNVGARFPIGTGKTFLLSYGRGLATARSGNAQSIVFLGFELSF